MYVCRKKEDLGVADSRGDTYTGGQIWRKADSISEMGLEYTKSDTHRNTLTDMQLEADSNYRQTHSFGPTDSGIHLVERM